MANGLIDVLANNIQAMVPAENQLTVQSTTNPFAPVYARSLRNQRQQAASDLAPLIQQQQAMEAEGAKVDLLKAIAPTALQNVPEAGALVLQAAGIPLPSEAIQSRLQMNLLGDGASAINDAGSAIKSAGSEGADLVPMLETLFQQNIGERIPTAITEAGMDNSSAERIAAIDAAARRDTAQSTGPATAKQETLTNSGKIVQDIPAEQAAEIADINSGVAITDPNLITNINTQLEASGQLASIGAISGIKRTNTGRRIATTSTGYTVEIIRTENGKVGLKILGGGTR